METKSFKEIVPIKKSSSGPTNSCKQAVTPQINACLRGFFSEKINLDISLYLTARSQILWVAVLRTVGEWSVCTQLTLRYGSYSSFIWHFG